MTRIPVTTDVENAKVRRVRMTVKKSGGGAKSAKEPAGGRQSRAKLIIAPSVGCGIRLVGLLGMESEKAAIVTDPTHLDGIAIFPNEEIIMVMGSDKGFMEQLQTAATMFVPGESFSLKMYAL